MNSLIALSRPLPWLRALALALVSIGAAGCSAESSRLGEAPYAAPGSQSEATGSIGQGAPVGHVESRPLPQTSQLPAPQSTVVAGGGRGMASYSPPVAPNTPPAAAPATYT